MGKRARGPCRAGIVGVCTGHARQRHHIHQRSHGGHVHTAEPLMSICAACHLYIHQHENWARTWGLLVPKGIDPRYVNRPDNPDPNVTGPIRYEGARRMAVVTRKRNSKEEQVIDPWMPTTIWGGWN